MKTSMLTYQTLGVLFIAFVGAVVVGATLFLITQPSSASVPEGISNPTTEASIALDPAFGYAHTPIRVTGKNWQPGDLVYVRLKEPGGQADPRFAYTSATVDAQGSFVARFTYPDEPRWLAGTDVVVVATGQRGTERDAPFVLAAPLQLAPAPTEALTETPTETPTEAPTPEPTVITVVLVTAPGESVGFVSGTVFDQVTQRGIPGAKVSTGVLTTTTDATGHYEFSKIIPGNYSLKAEAVGHNPVTTSLFSVGACQVVQVDLPLTPGRALAPHVLAAPLPEPSFPDWEGDYFNNPVLTPPAVFLRNDVNINFEWGYGSPGPGVPADGFSVRWTRVQQFDPGVFRFYAQTDGAVRVWIDDQLVINQAPNAAVPTYTVDLGLSPGAHNLRVEYAHGTGYSVMRFWWTLVPPPPPPPPQSFPDWRGEYFNNPDLSGSPVLVRNDSDINFDWDGDSPGPGVPPYDFSVRWTRDEDFSSDRTYRFYVTVDDGARLWVDGDLIIDEWDDGPERTFSADKFLEDEENDLRVEYYNHRGDAVIHVWWTRLDDKTRTPTPTRTATPTITPTPSPTPVLGPPLEDALIIPVPASGLVGTTVTVAGQNWPAGSTVFLTLADPGNAAVASIAQKASGSGFLVDAQGRFTGSIVIPTGQGWEGKAEALIVAYTGDLQVSALATFTITTIPPTPAAPATIQLSPPSGAVGTDIAVFGFNWPPGAEVFVTLANPVAQSVQVMKSAQGGGVTVGQNGEFQTQIEVPAGQGWENQESLLVVAFTSDVEVTASASFAIIQPTETVPVKLQAGPTSTPSPTGTPEAPAPTATPAPSDTAEPPPTDVPEPPAPTATPAPAPTEAPEPPPTEASEPPPTATPEPPPTATPKPPPTEASEPPPPPTATPEPPPTATPKPRRPAPTAASANGHA